MKMQNKTIKVACANHKESLQLADSSVRERVGEVGRKIDVRFPDVLHAMIEREAERLPDDPDRPGPRGKLGAFVRMCVEEHFRLRPRTNCHDWKAHVAGEWMLSLPEEVQTTLEEIGEALSEKTRQKTKKAKKKTRSGKS